MAQFTDKTVLVTGGTAGIGRAIALRFAREGASVAIFGTNGERASQVLEEMRSLATHPDQKFFSKLVDVSDKKAVDAAVADLGFIEILVNNAGITRDGLLMKMSEDDWDLVIAVNLKSIYNLSQAVIRPMLKARQGKIVNISSVVGLMGNAGQTNYAAAKAGMIGMTKALAKEVASRGICVNCIAPGFIQTAMTGVLTDEQKAAIFKQIPMGRLGLPEEIADAVLFLSGPGANYITGQTLTVDGGMVMH